MTQKQRLTISICAGLAMLLLLVGLTLLSPPGLDSLLPAILFGILVIFTTTFGVPLAEGRVSLLPMTTVAAYLVLGAVPAAWVAFSGALIHGWIHYRWAQPLGEQPDRKLLAVVGVAAANAAIQALSVLAGGLAFRWAGGQPPLLQAHWVDLPALLLLILGYLATNLLAAGLYIAARGPTPLKHYVRSLPNLLFYEGWTMVFAPLMALTYTQLGLGQFGLVALAIVAVSLAMRNLSRTGRRLQRRVNELDSLQAVGKALSTSLDLETTLLAIHTQVSGLMPAENFYVALYDAETDEVSFPLAIEEGQQVRWRSRQAGNGLTEHVLRTRSPLLICQDWTATLSRLGLDQIGQPAAFWLGVPILAGTEALGVIAVQSFSDRQSYDTSHQAVLITIAAQAAVAIQNARLYARTDEALARRVQELNSILRATREGVLLLDPGYNVLAANRALADFLGLAQLEIVGQNLHRSRPAGEASLLGLVGYTPESLVADCEALVEREAEFRVSEITFPGPPERFIERTLAPVRGGEGLIKGWLLVFRDRTEEQELANLRQDLTQMLIHDLRSPLAVVVTSLEYLEMESQGSGNQALGEIVSVAQQGSHHVLRLINDLLEINQLESGGMAIHPQPVAVADVLQRVAERLAPLAAQAQIELVVEARADLPLLCIDPDLIDRVLHNLGDNALKFTPGGGKVQMWARPDPGETAHLLVGVTDSGPGIPPRAQSKLFVKYQRAGSAPGRRPGLGLGLAFCKLAVEAHHGTIRVESQEGQGSTFVMRLPVAEITAERPGPEQS